MTETAPNTFTSNSRRIASSGKTSIGPGVEDTRVADQEIETRVAALFGDASSPGVDSRLLEYVADRQADVAIGSGLEVVDLVGGHRRSENDIAFAGEAERDVAAQAAPGAGDRRATA